MNLFQLVIAVVLPTSPAFAAKGVSWGKDTTSSETKKTRL